MDEPRPSGTSAQPVTTPVLTVDDDVLADLLLVCDGVVDGRCLTPGGEVLPPDPDGTTSTRVALRLTAGDRDLALAAGSVELSDAEGFPVVRLDDLAARGDLLVGDAGPTGRTGTGPGRSRRLPSVALPSAPGGRDVVVLTRPLLDEDEAALRARVGGGADVVLVVPVAGPSPDGLPVPLVLRTAERSARRTGAHLVAATLRRRDPGSDRNLLAHVARALGVDRVVDDLPGQERWRELLADHRDERDAAPGGPVRAEVVADLAAWWPPASRRGVVVLMTGLSGSGKSTLARALATHVRDATPRTVSLLDGDHVRRMLSSGLGFGRADRELNVLRIGYVATEVARHGGVAVCAPIAPYASTRAAVRRMVQEVGDLVLVHVSTPLAECERRDVKGLYARARAGEIPAFTGISDPYEEPEDADVVVDTSVLTPDEALARVLEHLVHAGRLPAAATPPTDPDDGAP